MGIVRSPLGALGALMVLLQAIAGGSLFGLQSQPTIQWVIVIMMVACISAITCLVIWLVIYFALKRPGLLFSPRDIESSVHMDLYGSSESPDISNVAPHSVTFSLAPEDSDNNI